MTAWRRIGALGIALGLAAAAPAGANEIAPDVKPPRGQWFWRCDARGEIDGESPVERACAFGYLLSARHEGQGYLFALYVFAGTPGCTVSLAPLTVPANYPRIALQVDGAPVGPPLDLNARPRLQGARSRALIKAMLLGQNLKLAALPDQPWQLGATIPLAAFRQGFQALARQMAAAVSDGRPAPGPGCPEM